MLAQTVANVGPLGIPAIASLIRSDLDLTLTQAGSFLSAYYVGPIGAGSVAKLVHNCAGYAIQTALAEVFTMGVKAGVNIANVSQLSNG